MDTNKQLQQLIETFEKVLAEQKIEWLQGASIDNIRFSTGDGDRKANDHGIVEFQRICRVIIVNGKKVTVCV